MVKRALITGLYGQDGSYTAEILSKKGYLVYGIIQDKLSANAEIIRNYLNKNEINHQVHVINLSNYGDVKNIFLEIKPNEVYHLAAYHVSSESNVNSHDFNERNLFEKNVVSTLNILSICHEYLPKTRVVTAGSCLMFDNSNTSIQNEKTGFSSSSLYGLAKITESNLVKYYRDKGMHASMAILYNHESSRRKDTFVTKKIIKNLIAIKRAEIQTFRLGNIDTLKDWGYAKDYVNAMFLMCSANNPMDYIISSGTSTSIRSFIEIAAKKLGIETWEKSVLFDEKIVTRTINTTLIGDSSLAKENLNWKSDTDINELIQLMIDNELNGTLK